MGGAGRRQEARAAQLHPPLLAQLPYHEIEHAPIELPARVYNDDYLRQPVPETMIVPEIY